MPGAVKEMEVHTTFSRSRCSDVVTVVQQRCQDKLSETCNEMLMSFFYVDGLKHFLRQAVMFTVVSGEKLVVSAASVFLWF